MTRFELNWAKAIQAIDYVAKLKPGLTQYYIGKIMFFADREHLLDFGRPITGDRYIAMEHGPIPSAIRDLLKSDSGYPDEILERFHERIVVRKAGNIQHVHSKGMGEFPDLSGSDMEYLAAALEKYGGMSFSRLKELSHKDPSYEAAWAESGVANEMNIELWFDSFDQPEVAKNQVREYAKFAV